MNLSPRMYQKLTSAWLLLRVGYSFLFIAAGADKFFNIITSWEHYVHPALLAVVAYPTLKIILAVVEITLGVATAFRWTRVGAYGISLWFLVIVVNLVAQWNYLDVAARDLILAFGAIALAQLTEVKEDLA